MSFYCNPGSAPLCKNVNILSTYWCTIYLIIEKNLDSAQGKLNSLCYLYTAHLGSTHLAPTSNPLFLDQNIFSWVPCGKDLVEFQFPILNNICVGLFQGARKLNLSQNKHPASPFLWKLFLNCIILSKVFAMSSWGLAKRCILQEYS